MDELGLYCILAINTGHRDFPKKRSVDAGEEQRFTTKFTKTRFDVEVGTALLFAGAFNHKIALLLFGSCGLSTLADEVERNRTE